MSTTYTKQQKHHLHQVQGPKPDLYCLSCLPTNMVPTQKNIDYCDPCLTSGNAYESVGWTLITPYENVPQSEWKRLGNELLDEQREVMRREPSLVQRLVEDKSK